MIAWFVRASMAARFQHKESGEEDQGHGAGKIGRFARRTKSGAQVAHFSANLAPYWFLHQRESVQHEARAITDAKDCLSTSLFDPSLRAASALTACLDAEAGRPRLAQRSRLRAFSRWIAWLTIRVGSSD